MTEPTSFGTPLDKVRVLEFPKICDPRGNLSFVEGGRHVPFPIRRVFYMYDLPGGETRGAHAHKKCSTVLLATSGSFDVRLTDGENETVITLNRANRALLIPPGVWDVLENFTTGTVVLAFASDFYEEEDYIRDYEDFLEYAKELRLQK